jgi:hypothetical protein
LKKVLINSNNFFITETDPNTCGAVVLQDGTKVKADVIVVGAGVVPSTVNITFR